MFMPTHIYVYAHTGPAQPLTLNYNTATALTITVTWTPQGNAEYYNIRIKEESDDTGDFMFVDQLEANIRQYTIEDLTPSTTYTIRLTAQCGTLENRAESIPRDITVTTSKLFLFIRFAVRHWNCLFRYKWPLSGKNAEDLPPKA